MANTFKYSFCNTCSIQVFCLNQQTGVSETSITYPVCLGRQESQYPVEAVDALMMILKETAPSCNLDCLVEVCCPVHSIFVRKKLQQCALQEVFGKKRSRFLYYDSLIVRN